jgi:hypothetical protein
VCACVRVLGLCTGKAESHPPKTENCLIKSTAEKCSPPARHTHRHRHTRHRPCHRQIHANTEKPQQARPGSTRLAGREEEQKSQRAVRGRAFQGIELQSSCVNLTRVIEAHRGGRRWRAGSRYGRAAVKRTRCCLPCV